MNNFGKNSVLIIDDETTNIIALTNILNSEYDIYAAKNGADAIMLAKDRLPDLILLDVIMPEMDGYEVIAALKSFETTKSIPVIFITGLDNKEAEKKGLALGAADYIPKPFSSDIVKLRVHNQLKIVTHTRALDERLRQQALMTKISHSFLTDAHIDSLFTDTLIMVGEFMDIAQVLLYKHEPDGNMLICQSEWIKPDLNLERRIGETFELKEPMLSIINGLLADDEETLCLHSNDKSFKEAMKPYRKNFNNYITAPIFVKGKLFAILDFSREDEREWTESEINLAVLVSSIFAGVFEREAMERQFSLVENSPNFILYITDDMIVEYVNPAISAVIGYTQDELIKKGLGVIFSRETLADIREKYIPNAMRGETALFEINVTRKDGEKRILRVSIVQTGKNNLGIITGDLTEIRELESGLIAAKEQAEYSKELAEHSSRAKSEFLSRMSHEMRTPMNAIIGMMQISKMRGVPDNIKRYFDEMDNASKHLLRLIDDVLDISGMEYGVFKLSDEVFDISATFSEALETAKYNAALKKQIFTSNLEPPMPTTLKGDGKRLKQVVSNLLANAVKYTPEQGEICFDARVLDQNDEVVTLQIEVADNGIGISEEQQNGLFDIFEQADGSHTRKHGGIGIGLALSKRIVEMMNGKIWVESELGNGAKFTFTCDLQKA